jgi:hypothetical protein
VFVNAYPGAVTRYSATLTKARIGKGDPMPEVSLPEGWRVVTGEEFSCVNVREAFFTFERNSTQVHHFYVDPQNGRLTSDCYQDMSRVMDVRHARVRSDWWSRSGGVA